MDLNSLIVIIIVIAIIYFIVKFIFAPALKLVGGIILFFIVLYILKNFFQVDFNKLLGPYGSYLDVDTWITTATWLINMLIAYIEQAISFIKNFSVPK